MVQRGRKSAASNVIELGINGLPPRLTAPAYLSKPEKVLFTEIIGNCDPRHFVASDLPLLISYIQATLLARRAATKLITKNEPGLATLWEKAIRVQAMLAIKLRLSPRSRTNPKTTARQAAHQTTISYYDRMEDDD